MEEKWIARKRADEKTQSLVEHTNNVAEISAARSDFPNTSRLIAHIHDAGKLSSEFQSYVRKNNNEHERGSIVHAWQGAFLVNELFGESNNSSGAMVLKEIIGMSSSAHHNYLSDILTTDGECKYYEKMGDFKNPKYYYEEIKSRVEDEDIDKLRTLFANAEVEINQVIKKIQEKFHGEHSAYFALGLLTKYLYSGLVDADRLDAYLFEVGEPYVAESTGWKPIIDTFEQEIAKFKIEKEMDEIRKSISEKCKYAADRETGIYQLSVPTGGGKTLSSLRFALHHCERYNKKRIIYVIPYLSIIDQTAAAIRKILDYTEEDSLILEHHSNVVHSEREADESDSDEKYSAMYKLSASRWDSPIVITTMVQFLESVMSAKGSKLRKFASMADSVIIFDEVQSIPARAIHCFNEIVSFLSQVLNTTIILCSATQPTLGDTEINNLLLHENADLIDCKEDFKDIQRVVISAEEPKDYASASEFIHEKAIINGNCLVIVNTRESALKLQGKIKELATGFGILHLSTSMCPAHRMKVINDMRSALEKKEKIICISTQLIEAGVDVSFACVVRAMAGLDSITQASGRCNRNGESEEPKITYTFELKEEDLENLSEIKSGKEITEQIIYNNPNANLLDSEVMADFYRRYFRDKSDLLYYPVKDSGAYIYDMLSLNKLGKQNLSNRTGQSFSHVMAQAFHSADQEFSVIDSKAEPVVVLYGESEDLITKYQSQPPKIVTKEKIKILKQLEKYSVSLYKWQIEQLQHRNAIYPLDSTDESLKVFYLDKSYYSQDTGVILDAEMENLII